MAKKQTASSASRWASWRGRIALALRIAAVAAPTLVVALTAYWAFTSAGGGIFALSKVEYQGLSKLHRSSLDKRIERSLSRNILQLDLEKIRRSVEGASWVKSAVVRRRLPNQLVISVVERRPAAVAQVGSKMMLVDPEGVLLGQLDPGDPLPEGPVVVGLLNPTEGNAVQQNRQRMQMYLQVIQDLSLGEPDYARRVSEVDVSNLKRVAVIPSDEPVPVYLGDQQFRRRYQVFESQRELYLEYKRKHGRIDEVDVSFEKRIIFKTPAENEKAVNLQPPASGTGL